MRWIRSLSTIIGYSVVGVVLRDNILNYLDTVRPSATPQSPAVRAALRKSHIGDLGVAITGAPELDEEGGVRTT